MSYMDRMTSTERQRFTEAHRVDESGCWLWNRYLDSDGYGTFWFRRVARRAHRVAYWASVGDIPKGNVIDHICSQRACVRPDHLRCLSARENTLLGNGVGAKNAQKTHCLHGHPFDRVYGGIRYCSVCHRNKKRRLTKVWREADTIKA